MMRDIFIIGLMIITLFIIFWMHSIKFGRKNDLEDSILDSSSSFQINQSDIINEEDFQDKIINSPLPFQMNKLNIIRKTSIKNIIINFLLIVCLICFVFYFFYFLFEDQIKADFSALSKAFGKYYSADIKIQKQKPKQTNNIKKGAIKDQKARAKQSRERFKQEAPLRIEINKPVPLSYKTKKEIYDIRKSYVAQSVFASDNYAPTEAVFGKIEDYKPWIDITNTCYNFQGMANIEGPSEEARYLLNPALLAGIDFTGIFLREKKGNEWCDKRKDYTTKRTTPNVIKYSKSKNTISVVYGALPWTGKNRDYQLIGINARDFGFNYVYLDKSKSLLHDMTFKDVHNVSNSVQKFKNFIHTGGACKVKGGCNNGSPLQPELSFNVYTSKIYNSKAGKEQRRLKQYRLYLKLWKNAPSSPDDKADIAEVIEFLT